jgi:peptidylprolyl isomerase/FKBP-type peptidyl-prolyl cis-trans isomerase FklB
MKHCFYFILAISALFSTFSCSKEDDDISSDTWRAANEQAFEAIKSNPEYTELKSPGNEGSICYKVLTKGTGTKPIYYNSTVKVYYSGKFIVDDTQYGIKKGSYFELKTMDYSTPSTFSLSGTIAGWKTALPNMVKGDIWEIYIPYQLGYGSSGQYNSSGGLTIPAYSTLVFEIEIVDVL